MSRARQQVPASELVRALRDRYGIEAVQIKLVAGGADPNASAFRVGTAGQDGAFLLKVRRIPVAPATVALPHLLHPLGIREVLAPVPTHAGHPAASWRGWQLILYPFVSGENAMQRPLSAEQWRVLGRALRSIHSAKLTPELERILPRDSFGPASRAACLESLRQAVAGEWDHAPTHGLAIVLKQHQDDIERMVHRADALSALLRRRMPPFVPCHSDLHKWNVLSGDDRRVWIVDWDDGRLAPKECDLMYIGGNIGGNRGDTEEFASFCDGYGPAEVDLAALAYYRYERILTDIALYAGEVFSNDRSADVDVSYIARLVASNFDPGGELEAAENAGARVAELFDDAR